MSWDDLWVMTCSGDLPPYVAQAARYLRDNLTLFDLVETSNDGMDYARDVLGGNGDQMISVGDIETVLQLNDRLAVVEQNAFDTAAHPGGPADGRISMGDLRALADGDDTGRGGILAAGPRRRPDAPRCTPTPRRATWAGMSPRRSPPRRSVLPWTSSSTPITRPSRPASSSAASTP